MTFKGSKPLISLNAQFLLSWACLVVSLPLWDTPSLILVSTFVSGDFCYYVSLAFSSVTRVLIAFSSDLYELPSLALKIASRGVNSTLRLLL